MKLLSAVLDKERGDLTLTINTDESAVIPDPEWVRPTKQIEEVVPVADGDDEATVEFRTITRTVPDEDAVAPTIPDPSVIRTFVYGAGPRGSDPDVGPNETRNAYEKRLDDHVRSALREMRLLLREERRSRKAEERAKDPEEPEVVSLLAEPVDLDDATLKVE
jgi:hypothetical protein